MAPLFYYTVSRKDIRSFMPTIPVMISAHSCLSKGKTIRLLPPNLPSTITQKAADCGGFPVTHFRDGVYPYSHGEYITWLAQYEPQWAATPDLCCVDLETKGNPGASIVKERQEFAKEQAEMLFFTACDVSWAWVPTIQGFTPDEYYTHACMMENLIQQIWCYYQEMAELHMDTDEEEMMLERAANFRVGIGSLVGRKPDVVREIILTVQSVLGKHVSLHCWGLKKAYLDACQQIRGVVSYDSGAYNNRFGRDLEKQKGLQVTQSRFLWETAQPKYAKGIDKMIGLPQQQPLFVPDQEPVDLAKAQQLMLDSFAES